MGIKLFWKSVLRRRASLALLLALLMVADFGFVLRAVEYLAVSQEIERISEEYRPIGTLSSQDEYVTAGAALITESPYVSFADIQRSCPAVLSDIYNADLDQSLSEHREDYYGYGVWTSNIMVWGEVLKKTESSVSGYDRYDFRVTEGVLGYPEYINSGKRITLDVKRNPSEGQEEISLEEGKTYLIKGYPPSFDNVGYYGDRMVVRMLPLTEELWFLEGEPDAETALQYIDADDRLQERNRHTMVAITTADMSAMPLVQEISRDYYLEEGRWLNRQDQEESHKVCVITKEFAQIRGLSVGDSLTMTLQDKVPTMMGCTSNQEEDIWETCDKTEVTLEIVGIYGRIYGEQSGIGVLSRYSSYIYIPDSCLPESYVGDSDIWQGSFSFVLNSPKDKDAFVQEITGKLEPLGITLDFVENNWDSFYGSAKAIQQGGFYNLLVFLGVLVLALAATAFLYTWQRKKETAIARAVGIPARKAALCACLPMMILGAAGILAGSEIAWRYGLEQAGKTLAVLAKDSHPQLPRAWFAGNCLLIWLLLTLVLLLGNLLHARKPVLEILQGGRTLRQKKPAAGNKALEKSAMDREISKKSTENGVKAECSVIREEVQKGAAAKRIPSAAAARFLGRHLRRFSLRTLFSLLAAAAFVTASCWLYRSIKAGEARVDELYRTTVVEAEITKKNATVYFKENGGAFIKTGTIQKLLDTGFVTDYYLEAGLDGYVGEDGSTKKIQATFLGISDLDYYTSKMEHVIQIHYGEGYEDVIFDEVEPSRDTEGLTLEYPPVLVPEELWLEMGFQAGDKITLSDTERKIIINVIVIGYCSGSAVEIPVLVPLKTLGWLGELSYSAARFNLDPEKNRELEEFRIQGREIVEASDAGRQNMDLVIRDSELRQAVEPMEKNVILMEILYPLANLAAFLIAIGLSILLLFQRRKEAAVLRVLGVGRLTTRLVLILELLLLDFIGVLLGAVLAGVLAKTAGIAATPLAVGCYFLGCLIGTIAGAAWVTSGRPLALLQEKE